jgi:hypothetical protein
MRSIGDRYGRWAVVEDRGKWALCRCDCGTEREVRCYTLRAGDSTSCGCARKETVGRLNRKHGLSHRSSEYRIWKGMRARCSNPNDFSYKWYGARGICVCPEWDDFEVFLADMGRRPSASHSLERIDANGPYARDNCKWATASEQARNKRGSLFVKLDGVVLPLAEACEQTGINYHTAHHRLEKGWPEELALSKPPLHAKGAHA